MVILLVAEVAVGGVNVLLLAPVWMQVVHLLLADLLWICLVLAAAASLPGGKSVLRQAAERAPHGHDPSDVRL